jgi:rRNA biogenesis protein RRP5
MQYKYGFIEEARTSFEILLKQYPKRSDIWNVYIDKEIKIVKNSEKIRHIFEKCLTVDFKIKALKTIIKKYLEYEKENGNKKTIEHVVNLTQKLISKKISDVRKNETEENDDMDIDG